MLPRVPSYPLPTEADLPAGRADWQPAPDRALLLIHDMQRYFLAPFGAQDSPLPPVVANIAAIRGRCAALGVPVVYSAQPGGQDRARRGLLYDLWGAGLPDDPAAAGITGELAPGPADIVLTKHRYSAFVGTGLAGLFGDRDQIIVTGVYGHIGVLATALDAFMRDIRPFVVADAIADFGPGEHADTLRQVARQCGRVLTCRGLLGALPAPGGPPAPGAPAAGIGLPDRVTELRDQVIEVLGEPVGVDDNLLDAGLDSIRLMTLVERWRADGREVSFVDLADRPTIAGWAELLERSR